MRSELERILDADEHPPTPVDVTVMLGGPAPSPEQLAALGVAAESIRIVEGLCEHSERIALAVREDREFAARLVTDPAAALAELGSSAELIAAVADAPHRERFLTRFNGLRFEVPVEAPEKPRVGVTRDATAIAVLLLADALALAAADPAQRSVLMTDPRRVVLDAAAAFAWALHGISPGSSAAASIVQEVTGAIAGTLGLGSGPSGRSGRYERPDLEPTAPLSARLAVRIPTPPRGDRTWH